MTNDFITWNLVRTQGDPFPVSLFHYTHLMDDMVNTLSPSLLPPHLEAPHSSCQADTIKWIYEQVPDEGQIVRAA